eukprot:scaffold7993_cov33-Tisochrysis_lutea.AAC.2
MMVANPPSVALPGRPDATDEAEFMADPRGFCSSRMPTDGAVFATGAFDNAIFAGSTKVIDAATEAGECVDLGQHQLREPFRELVASAPDGKTAFETICASFNDECYAGFFQWVPLFKETGGFSTFRFEDFIDPRVRKALPGLRRVIFRATAPTLLGSKLEDLPTSPGLESPKDWGKAYAEYAAEKMKPASPSFPLLFKLPTIGGGGPSLETALGAEKAGEVLSVVEPTAALVASMLRMVQAYPDWDTRLADEQKRALSGSKPESPIDSKILGDMPSLEAFALETLRMYPPSRPSQLRLTRKIDVDGMELPAGAIVAPEPFVGHFVPSLYERPDSFNPDRFMGAEIPAPSMGFPGYGGVRGNTSRDLILSLAKVAFVQMRRMHEVKLPTELPNVAGYPLHSIPDSVELKAVPYMYYELQRGVRKLRF